jgi:hypothetical protein
MGWSDVEAIVYDPVEAEKILGTWGRNRNLVLIAREDKAEDPMFQEIINWIVENDIRCIAVPAISRQEMTCLMLLFEAFELEESWMRLANDHYMLLKLTFSGQGVSAWRDKDYQKCVVGRPER